MSLRHRERDVLAPLLCVIVLATTGCGDDDTSRSGPTRERTDSADVRTAEKTDRPASVRQSPGRANPSGEKRFPVGGRAAAMRRLHGRRIRVDGVPVTIDRETLACGRVKVERLRCVQPTFAAGGLIGPDATFFVQRTRAGRLVIRDARLTSY
jgi:hypothetical protein